jgi:hypothetical protein
LGRRGMRAVHPDVQLVQDGQGARATDLASDLRIDIVAFAFDLDKVEVSEGFERDDGASVFRQECGIKIFR